MMAVPGARLGAGKPCQPAIAMAVAAELHDAALLKQAGASKMVSHERC
jgi:hypothetical protein